MMFFFLSCCICFKVGVGVRLILLVSLVLVMWVLCCRMDRICWLVGLRLGKGCELDILFLKYFVGCNCVVKKVVKFLFVVIVVRRGFVSIV